MTSRRTGGSSRVAVPDEMQGGSMRQGDLDGYSAGSAYWGKIADRAVAQLARERWLYSVALLVALALVIGMAGLLLAGI